MWRMPLWENYASGLNSRIADVKSTSDGPFGGAITAALFLQKFVTNCASWVHFDMYGWRSKPAPGHAIGGEAQAIRALFTMLEERY